MKSGNQLGGGKIALKKKKSKIPAMYRYIYIYKYCLAQDSAR